MRFKFQISKVAFEYLSAFEFPNGMEWNRSCQKNVFCKLIHCYKITLNCVFFQAVLRRTDPLSVCTGQLGGNLDYPVNRTRQPAHRLLFNKQKHLKQTNEQNTKLLFSWSVTKIQ